ncbi:cyclophilin-like fold protein [Isoptericola hypogeus]|uniref:cyclophilin-like fold protein n=1 Tax=Isoptericola hypogeus TaxID=300179 RepID=UPI0031D409BF
MHRPTTQAVAAALPAALLVLLTGCSSEPSSSAPSTPAAGTSSAPSPSEPTPSAASEADDGVVGTVVRFSSDEAEVDVLIDQDTPAVRDFLSMLPLSLEFEEYNGREKIAYPPRPLERGDTPGSQPVDGDFIYFEPWGNFGFYYNAEGSGFEETTVHLGTFDATLGELERLEGAVAVDVVD